MNPLGAAMMIWSVLFPAKLWYAPDQPVMVRVAPEANSPVTLVLTDFTGKPFDPRGGADIDTEKDVDVKSVFTQLTLPGTYVLFAVAKPANGQATASDVAHFVGTPLVIEVRQDKRRDAPQSPLVVHVEALRYALISTDRGEMTAAFYYDDAPNTVTSFLSLAEGGFYDGLLFHRIVPGFVVQTGDPRNDGTGGPGFNLPAEFNDRPHLEGVLSMARQQDPVERQGSMPRSEYANSAGSQFFICLNYDATKQLDGRYTAFGRVVDGIEALHALASAPVGGPSGDRPEKPPVIKSIKVLPVRPGSNPYAQMMSFVRPATAPSTQ
jgi:cyclophilin family peptidyl-prolyl cis-trans isomerase